MQNIFKNALSHLERATKFIALEAVLEINDLHFNRDVNKKCAINKTYLEIGSRIPR